MDTKTPNTHEQIRSLRGKVRWTGDLDAMRRDRVVEPIERASISSLLAARRPIDPG